MSDEQDDQRMMLANATWQRYLYRPMFRRPRKYRIKPEPKWLCRLRYTACYNWWKPKARV